MERVLLKIYGFMAIIIAILYGICFTNIISNETRAIVIRIRFLVLLECLLSIGTIFEYVQIHHFAHFRSTARLSLRVKVLYSAVCMLAFGAHLSWFTNYIIGPKPSWIGLLTYSCLGMHIQLIIFLASGQFLEKVLYFMSKGGVFPYRYDENLKLWVQQKFCSRGKFWLMGIIYAVLLGLYGLYNTQIRAPELRSVDLKINNLPKSFETLTIVQINDIHLGPTVGQSQLENIVRTIESINPDLVVVVGDLTDGTVNQLYETSSPLKRIRPILGKYYVTGNHEYYTGDADNWLKHMESMGFNSLHNSHHVIRNSREPNDFFYIAGTDDIHAKLTGYTGHGFDIDKAMKGCEDNVPVILLTHQPKAAKIALDSGYRDIELVLAGHTHGGQLFPFTLIYCWLNPFCLGLYEYNGKYVYVSEGTQYWGIPMRIFTRMEITVLSISSKHQ